MILVEACKQFLNNGINVVPFKTTPDPIKSHKFNKKPVIKEVSNFFNHFLLKSKVEEVFKPANSVALVCGAISKNLIVIDVENANYTASKMYDEFKEHFDSYIDDLKIPIVKTRGGGFHVYFRVRKEDEILLKTQTLAQFHDHEDEKDKILVEVRGTKAFCNTYPSDGYIMKDNDIFNIPTLDSILSHEIYNFFISYDCNIDRHDDFSDNIDKNAPEYLYNKDSANEAQIFQLLKNKGWNVEKTAYKGEKEYYFLRRPGKNQGTSATFLFPPDDDKKRPGLYLFTSNTAPFPRTGFFSLFECLKYLQFDNDYDKTIQTVVNSGYGHVKDYALIDSSVKSFILRGIKKELSVSDIATQFPYENPEFLNNRIEYLYKLHKREFGLKKKSSIDLLKYALNKKYKLWLNKYGGIVMRGTEQVSLNKYWSKMVCDFDYKGGIADFSNHCRGGEVIPEKDQIDLFFKTSPAYDRETENSYMNEFAKKLHVRNVVSDVAKLELKNPFDGKIWDLDDFHSSMLQKHLIRSIAQFYEGKPNRYMLVYQGGEGIFKSEHIRYLSRFLPSPYFSEERFKNITIDVKYKACRTFINNVEEFDGIKNIDDIKDIISKIDFNDRLAHKPDFMIAKRIVNYFGTTNKDDFLPFDQENTRFLCFPVESINGDYSLKFNPCSNNIDPRNIWREAFYLYKKHVQNNYEGYKKYCELSKEEKQLQNCINSLFTNASPVSYSVQKTIKKPLAKSERKIKINLADLQNLIRDNFNIPPQYKKDESLSKKALKIAIEALEIEKIERKRYVNFEGKTRQGDYYIVELIIF